MEELAQGRGLDLLQFLQGVPAQQEAAKHRRLEVEEFHDEREVALAGVAQGLELCGALIDQVAPIQLDLSREP